jgi:hypothetical protein
LIIVKFADGMEVRLENGSLVSLSGADVSSVRMVFENNSVSDVRALFSREVPELENERRRAQQSSGVVPPDLTLFFVITLSPGASPPVFITNLLADDNIENAYVAPKPAPPPGP